MLVLGKANRLAFEVDHRRVKVGAAQRDVVGPQVMPVLRKNSRDVISA